jgi:hypothetical protein
VCQVCWLLGMVRRHGAERVDDASAPWTPKRQRRADRPHARPRQSAGGECPALGWAVSRFVRDRHCALKTMIARQCDEPETGLCAQPQGYHSGSPNDHPNATEFRERPLQHV